MYSSIPLQVTGLSRLCIMCNSAGNSGLFHCPGVPRARSDGGVPAGTPHPAVAAPHAEHPEGDCGAGVCLEGGAVCSVGGLLRPLL